MASIFRNAVIHMLATWLVAAAVRAPSQIPSCEAVGAKSTGYTHTTCYCPPEEFAIGDGCGNAFMKDRFRLNEIGVGDCSCKKPSCSAFGGVGSSVCHCTKGHELQGPGCSHPVLATAFKFGEFDLAWVEGPHCACAYSERWKEFKEFCRVAGGEVDGLDGGRCRCPENQGFLGDHCPVSAYFDVLHYGLSADVRSANDCTCKFSSGFLEASRVTAVHFCETVVQAAKKKTETPDHHYDFSEIAFLISEWMTETWATEICSAVVSRLEEPSEGINQLQTNQRPKKKMIVHPKSRAWYLLEEDQPGHKSLKVALKKVCHDECEDLVKKMRDVNTSWYMLRGSLQVTMAERCAEMVVQKVEAEILGCCAQSCGWNGRTCGFWDFMTHADQKDWKLECCAEGAILKGSSRQKMCNSVLSKERQRIVAEHDEPYNTSGLPSFVGQDFDGVDFPSSASMLEVTQRKCEITVSGCHKGQQKNMWIGCAEEYQWKMLLVDIKLPKDKCNSKTSNTRFVDCEPDEEMPHVKWTVKNGKQTCTRFDNACKNQIEEQVQKKALKPDDWRNEKANNNPRVFRFIKLGQ